MTKRILTGLATTLCAVLATATVAEPDTNWGPAVGSTIPHTLAARDQSGDAREFNSLRDSNGLVLVFVRSADWCRFCKRQLVQLNKRLEAFTSRGYALVSVSYDSVETLREFGQSQQIGYPMLSDPDSDIIDAFGVRNHKHKPGDSGFGIPNPGIVVIDAQRRVALTIAERGYAKRPDIDDVLARIDALTTPTTTPAK